MESFVYRQLVRQAAFLESIPLGARKTPGYQACVHNDAGTAGQEPLCAKHLKLE
jgi:hypothetical protein